MTEILSAVDLVAGFPGHEPVLDGASVRVRRGARMALLGPNGSGKTTLLRCLAGSLKPLRGTIRAENRYVSEQSEGEDKPLGARFVVRLPAAPQPA